MIVLALAGAYLRVLRESRVFVSLILYFQSTIAMNGLDKCMKIRHVVRLRQIARKWRKIANARKAAQALACKLLSPRSCRVSYVSDDEQVDGKKSTNGHRRSGSVSAVPSDVPSGHLAVYVGQQCSTRFVIQAAYLNHPVFLALLEKAEEEFGYAHKGGLAIPCDELLFEHILRLFNRNDPAAVRQLDLEAVQSNFCNEWHCSSEAKGTLFDKDRSLLHAFAEKSVG